MVAATVPRVNPAETAAASVPETVIKAPRRWGWPSGRELWEYRDLLYVLTNRGSEVYGFDAQSRPALLWARVATAAEDRLLDTIAEAVRAGGDGLAMVSM